MGNLIKKLETVQEKSNARNQSPTATDTVNISSLNPNFEVKRLVDELDDRRETNAVDEQSHHHHERLDVGELENSLSWKLQLNNLNEDDLNEDCLLEIFSYLSMDDMMQIKRVCKKWYQVSQLWFKQVQTLVYNNDCVENGTMELHEKYYKRKIYEKNEIHGFNDLISILHSCGHHIKYYRTNITEEDNSTERQKFIYQWVPKLCKNIVDLQIYGVSRIYTPSTFKDMATHWKKLEKIDFECLPLSVEKDFREVLRNNQQLKSLSLWFEYDHGCFMDDKFFIYLPTTIEKIDIKLLFTGEKNQLTNFISASKNFTSLQSLQLTGFHYLTDALVAAISDIKSLTDLSLYGIRHYEYRRTIDSIANLKDLKFLNLSYNSDLNEDSLMNILESCIQLETLDISNDNDYSLSDEGMAAIAKLTKLKSLKINVQNVTSESIISSCSSLEVLFFIGGEINNCDTIKLLKRATNLRFFRFANCDNLTKDVLQAASEIANERKNNILCVSGYFDCVDVEDIDTPYFKYYQNQGIPMGIFPNDIKNFIERFL